MTNPDHTTGSGSPANNGHSFNDRPEEFYEQLSTHFLGLVSGDYEARVADREEHYRIEDEAKRRARSATGSNAAWQEVDLLKIISDGIFIPEPSVMLRVDELALIYREQANVIFGDPSSGKTWLGIATTAQELERGNHVYVVDFETNINVWLSRLISMGVSTITIIDRLHYLDVHQLGQPPAEVHADASLVVVDSLTAVIESFGYEPNDATGIEGTYRRVIDPFTQNGLAALIIDHVGHADKSRPMNSIRKTGRVQGAMYRVEVMKGRPFARDQTGEALLFLHKDNLGGTNLARGEIAGKFVLESTEGGTRVRCQIVDGNDLATLAAAAAANVATDPVTVKKLEILQNLQVSNELGKTALYSLVRGKRQTFNDALDELVSSGEVISEVRSKIEYFKIS